MRFYFYFQLLQIRQSLQASFEGCDICTPRKPKGLASKALEEWKKHYPNSEETNKTIGKQAKFTFNPNQRAKNFPFLKRRSQGCHGCLMIGAKLPTICKTCDHAAIFVFLNGHFRAIKIIYPHFIFFWKYFYALNSCNWWKLLLLFQSGHFSKLKSPIETPQYSSEIIWPLPRFPSSILIFGPKSCFL